VSTALLLLHPLAGQHTPLLNTSRSPNDLYYGVRYCILLGKLHKMLGNACSGLAAIKGGAVGGGPSSYMSQKPEIGAGLQSLYS